MAGSVPEVFIIESVTWQDEKEHYFEGEVLYQVLKMCGKKPIYYRIRTECELSHVARFFSKSNYRFLHLSCHGSTSHLGLTIGSVSYERFAQIFSSLLKIKRLVVSACEVGNEKFFREVQAENKGIHSILCPMEDIRFDHAVALWVAFYVQMFSLSDERMRAWEIRVVVGALCELFDVSMKLHWYKPYSDSFHAMELRRSAPRTSRINMSRLFSGLRPERGAGPVA